MPIIKRCGDCGIIMDDPLTHDYQQRRARLAQVIDADAVLRRRLAWGTFIAVVCGIVAIMGKC